MTDALATAAAWLADKRHAYLATAVTYRRGDDEVELRATRGRSDFEVADDHGVVLEVQTIDFLIRADDLVLAGQATLPRTGDHVETDCRLFEVRAPGGQAPWRYAGPHRHTIRVHTKEVDTA